MKRNLFVLFYLVFIVACGKESSKNSLVPDIVYVKESDVTVILTNGWTGTSKISLYKTLLLQNGTLFMESESKCQASINKFEFFNGNGSLMQNVKSYSIANEKFSICP